MIVRGLIQARALAVRSSRSVFQPTGLGNEVGIAVRTIHVEDRQQFVLEHGSEARLMRSVHSDEICSGVVARN